MHRIALALLSLPSLVFVGCPGSGPSGDAPTYYTDIQPIVQTHCARCHFEAGLGTGDFTNPEAVQQWGEAMATAMEAGRMPPPAADPSCADYEASEYLSVDPAAVQAVRAWVDAGKPMGDPADAVTAEGVPTELPGANRTLTMPAPYTPAFDDPDFPGNEYRCFILENDDPETWFITGLAPEVDALSIAHHIVLATIDKDDSSIPDHVPEEGFECAEFNILDGMLAGWAPGMAPVELQDGYGLPVTAEKNIVMQMHYYESQPGEVVADQSGYSFRYEREVDTTMRMLPIGSFNWTIPAGDGSFTDTTSFNLTQLTGAPISVEVFGTFPHMHVLGKAYKMWTTDPDGNEQCIVESQRYAFDNQMTYVLRDPIEIGPQDDVHFQCTWDNSDSNPNRIHDEPRDTDWGEGTDQEMCFFFTYGAISG